MSKEIPYQPMHKRRLVTEERMAEILAKHTKPRIVESPKAEEPAAQSPQAKPLERMKWRKCDANRIESNHGYVVLRCTRDGVPFERYLAFKVTPEWTLTIGGYDSGEDARIACDAHRAKLQAA